MQVILIVTDGLQTPPGNPFKPADKLKDRGFEIYAVGAGQDRSHYDELARLKNKDVYFVPEARELPKLINQVAQSICPSEWDNTMRGERGRLKSAESVYSFQSQGAFPSPKYLQRYSIIMKLTSPVKPSKGFVLNTYILFLRKPGIFCVPPYPKYLQKCSLNSNQTYIEWKASEADYFSDNHALIMMSKNVGSILDSKTSCDTTAWLTKIYFLMNQAEDLFKDFRC